MPVGLAACAPPSGSKIVFPRKRNQLADFPPKLSRQCFAEKQLSRAFLIIPSSRWWVATLGGGMRRAAMMIALVHTITCTAGFTVPSMPGFTTGLCDRLCACVAQRRALAGLHSGGRSSELGPLMRQGSLAVLSERVAAVARLGAPPDAARRAGVAVWRHLVALAKSGLIQAVLVAVMFVFAPAPADATGATRHSHVPGTRWIQDEISQPEPEKSFLARTFGRFVSGTRSTDAQLFSHTREASLGFISVFGVFIFRAHRKREVWRNQNPSRRPSNQGGGSNTTAHLPRRAKGRRKFGFRLR